MQIISQLEVFSLHTLMGLVVDRYEFGAAVVREVRG